jgi:serine/threonine protein kinase
MNSLGNASDFETHEVLGKGAYGTVYRGTNKQNGEVIALKVGTFRDGVTGTDICWPKVIDLDHPDNEDINEIQREVALLSQLRDAANHNITLYYGCWIKGMELWIAMDYASGGSIRTLVSRLRRSMQPISTYV